jgi:hypothetical protein
MYIWESIIIPRANEYIALKAAQKQQKRGKV